jgi:hypothetical protein
MDETDEMDEMREMEEVRACHQPPSCFRMLVITSGRQSRRQQEGNRAHG